MTRCNWAVSDLMVEYHDTEWGVFTTDDIANFEHLSLEGFQAGLSWETVLKKRGNLKIPYSFFCQTMVQIQKRQPLTLAVRMIF